MNKKTCLCKKCTLKGTSDCPVKKYEQLFGRHQVEDFDKNITRGSDGHIYVWDGPQARWKMMY